MSSLVHRPVPLRGLLAKKSRQKLTFLRSLVGRPVKGTRVDRVTKVLKSVQQRRGTLQVGGCWVCVRFEMGKKNK